MDVKYINPFLAAVDNIVGQVIGIAPSFEKPFIKRVPFSSKDLLIIIGITGEINGKVMINTNRDSCINIASRMMGGVPAQFDEITKSAVGELCNMILGYTAMIFEKEGTKIDITSPTIIEGVELKVSLKEQIICVPINIGAGIKIELNISTQSGADVI